jgi:succinate dehydrogenase/fumarate reductase flavoprotein subunit
VGILSSTLDTRHSTLRQCDVLIIGGGGAGALAAIEASKDEKLRVMLLSKGPIGMSGLTPTANGGTAGAGPEENLFNLMITTGRYLNDQDIAWFMTHEIKKSLERLKDLGVSVVPLRARSVAVQSTDALRRLRYHVKHRPNIELREDVLVTRLFTSGGEISGACALDLVTGECFAIQAKAIVLATGGSTGELYTHTSNNPFGISTGAAATGHVMAFRAGAHLVDMEMIQFLPLPARPRGLYIRYFPEFWNGPYRNRMGEAIEDDVSRYGAASYSAELVQKIFFEMAEGRGPVCIDQRSSTAIDQKLLIKGWEQRRRLIKSIGIDPRETKIELLLGSHFSMGGVKVNAKTETTIPGLFATGEIMGGVHGACRLSGFSFSQMIVFGFEAGKWAAAYAQRAGHMGPIPGEEVETEAERLRRFTEPKKDALSVTVLKDRLKQVMDRDVFVVRNKEGLTRATKEINEIERDIARIQVPRFVRSNLEWTRAIEFPFVVEAARLATHSALAREESRGFHYRSDFPKEDDARWLCHTLVRLEGAKLVIGTAMVVLDHLKPEAHHG